MNKASIILQQLGSNRFIAMTGAKAFGVVANGEGLGFRIPKSKDGINHIEIVLNGKDLYDMTFSKIVKYKLTVVSVKNDIFCDMLQEVFTDVTGLYTKL
jgi:hypothetical protein